ncbi:MAG: threonylcarbamoyl-AMP synthase [Deltaproteobacteria bacterium]|nr:threonylcarbamoyl-AMP synthase [Deltaproteobacteria bacterium]
MSLTKPLYDPSELNAAVSIVKQRGVVALPFERLFGLAADASDAAAVARVVATKRRSADEPIAVIVPDLEAVRRLTKSFGPLARRLANRYWPGPLTILLEAAPGVPEPLIGRSGLIGVRIPGPSAAAELVKRTQLVLTATSANLSGGVDACSHEDIANLVGPDLVVKGSVPGPPGSTVVDASTERPVVIRSGIISLDEEK